MQYIGIVVAMDEECQEILNLMENKEEKVIYNLRFITGNIKNKKCVLIKSGVGKVNAARTTQILIDYFKIELVINAGAAGAVNSRLNIGDVVIAKHVVQHDFDITAFGHSKGYITGVGEKIHCDKKFISIFEDIVKNMKKELFTIKIGVVASGDIFCTQIKMKNELNEKFNADVVDMECASVAQVCFLDNIPFVSIRCVSDIPNESNETTFDENLKLASKRCSDIIQAFCSGI